MTYPNIPLLPDLFCQGCCAEISTMVKTSCARSLSSFVDLLNQFSMRVKLVENSVREVSFGYLEVVSEHF